MPRFLAVLLACAAVAAVAVIVAVAVDSGGGGGGGGGGGCAGIRDAPELRAGERFTLELEARPIQSETLPVGKWSRLAFVGRGKRVDVYVDGKRAETVSAASLASEDGALRPRCAPIWNGFEGRVGGVRTYDRALDTAEIAAGVTPRMYWGAWVDNADGNPPFEMQAQDEFERRAGKTASIIHWSSPWEASQYCGGGGSAFCPFRTADFEAVRARGSIPFFSWGPNFLSWSGKGAPPSDRQIAEGAEDRYVTEWAEAAREWGHPLFLHFAWEMNGDWFRWGVGEFTENGERFANTAADYVAMWRHVHDIFAKKVGAENVTWVWCPTVDPHERYAPIASLYPGDAYVDWTCLDAYNWGKPWVSFDDLFRGSYEEITGSVAPGKPLIIGETASTENGGSKAEWIDEMFSSLAASYPRVHGLLWFEVAREGPGDWPIESSAQAAKAFAEGIQSGLYAPARYGKLETTPIPPP